MKAKPDTEPVDDTSVDNTTKKAPVDASSTLGSSTKQRTTSQTKAKPAKKVSNYQKLAKVKASWSKKKAARTGRAKISSSKEVVVADGAKTGLTLMDSSDGAPRISVMELENEVLQHIGNPVKGALVGNCAMALCSDGCIYPIALITEDEFSIPRIESLPVANMLPLPVPEAGCTFESVEAHQNLLLAGASNSKSYIFAHEGEGVFAAPVQVFGNMKAVGMPLKIVPLGLQKTLLPLVPFPP